MGNKVKTCPNCKQDVHKTAYKRHRNSDKCRINGRLKDGYIHVTGAHAKSILRAYQGSRRKSRGRHNYHAETIQNDLEGLSIIEDETGLYLSKKQYGELFENYLIFTKRSMLEKVEITHLEDGYLSARDRPGNDGWGSTRPNGKTGGEGQLRYYRTVRDIGQRYVFYTRSTPTNPGDNKEGGSWRKVPYSNYHRLDEERIKLLSQHLYDQQNGRLCARLISREEVPKSLTGAAAASAI